MKTSLNIKNKLSMISEMKGDSIFQVLEYDTLKGGDNIDTAIKLSHMREAGITLKQVRILLNDSTVKIKKGALSYLKGNVEVNSKATGVVGLSKKIFLNKINNDIDFNSIYEGHGEIFLQPSFLNYALLELEDDTIIINSESLYACEESIEVIVKKNISSMMSTNEHIFEMQLKGSGIVVLELPVPENEIFKCKINNDVLKIDGNFMILRIGEIELTIEKHLKPLEPTTSGRERFLNVFRGTGEVWLVPTKQIYDNISSVIRTNNSINYKEG